MHPVQRAVRKVLEPHHPAIRQVITNAWGKWLSLDGRHRYALSAYPTVRANVIWGFIQDETKRLFQGRPIRPIFSNNTTTFLIDNQVLIRFKKLNERGGSNNFPTNRSLQFNENLDLPGIPSGLRVDVGYVLNDLETAINSIMVSYRKGDEVIWTYDIESHVIAPVEQIRKDIDQPTTVTHRRIRPRMKNKVSRLADEGEDTNE